MHSAKRKQMFCASCTDPSLSQWFNSDLVVLLSKILFTFSLAQLRPSVLEEAIPLGCREGDRHCIHCQFFGVIHSCSYFCHNALEASKINFLPAANCQPPPSSLLVWICHEQGANTSHWPSPKEIPPECISSITVHNVHRIRVILLPFAHFLAITRK